MLRQCNEIHPYGRIYVHHFSIRRFQPFVIPVPINGNAGSVSYLHCLLLSDVEQQIGVVWVLIVLGIQITHTPAHYLQNSKFILNSIITIFTQ